MSAPPSAAQPIAAAALWREASTGASARLVVLGLVALAALFYVFPLAVDIPLIDPDEGLHAAIAQEMVERGHYFVPTFLGEPFLDKPILFFWSQALSLKLFGMNDTAARLPGLLFGLFGAISTGLVARALLGRSAGVLAGCLYATMLMPLGQSQAAGPDVALISWINLAVLFLWRADRATARSTVLRAGAVAGVFLGLALLTKGLVGIALVCLMFGGLRVLRRPSTHVISALVVAGVVAIALALPWYLGVERIRPGYLKYYFIDRHLLAYLSAGQRHGDSPWWYYVPILLGGGLPWLVYVPIAAFERWRDRRIPRRELDLLWIWLAAGFLFFSAGSSKLPTYLLPIFPAVAILAAGVWRDLLTTGRAGSGRLLTAAIVAHLAVVALLTPIALVVIRTRYGIEPPWHIWLFAGLAAFGAAAIWRVWSDRGPRAAFAVSLGLSAAIFVIAVALLLPPVADATSAEQVAAHFNRLGSLPAQVWIVEDRVGSVVFYLDARLRSRLTSSTFRSISLASIEGEINHAAPDVVLAVRDRRLDGFERVMDLHGAPIERRRGFHFFTLPFESPAGVR